MSSVQSFLKQIVPVKAHYDYISGASTYYELQGANIPGNYPGSAGFVVAIGSGALLTTLQTMPANTILRDMGKTIRAPVGSLSGAVGYFRQMQVLLPTAITNAQGFIGGAAGNNFGVTGAPAAALNAASDPYTSYLTVYLPVTANGVFAGNGLYNGDVLSATSM